MPAALKSWLRDFISSCLRRLKIPKIWRRALVVAIPKPGKPVGDPKSYRPISLLCVPYKILERLIYARVEPLIDPLLPKEQAGFRRGKCLRWHRGLTCKLLRLLPDPKSKIPVTKQRGYAVAFLWDRFNIYTYDLPSMISRKLLLMI